MRNIPFLIRVFASEALQRNFLIKAFLFGVPYLGVALVLFEFKSYQNILSQTYAFSTKLQVLFALLIDSFKALGTDSLFILLISLLFGLNLELVLRKIKFLKSKGNLHITLGAGIVSLFSVGCAACGLSFASVIGIASTLSLLPYHGLIFYLLSIIVLLASLFYNLHVLVKVCKIKR